MDIQPTARQAMPNFASITSSSGSSSSTTQYGSSMSVTSNDRTVLERQLKQIKAEIQSLNGQNGSAMQMQKLETQMSDIQKRLQDLAARKAPEDIPQTQKNADAVKAQTDFSKGAAVEKDAEKKASVYSFIGMFLDVYA